MNAKAKITKVGNSAAVILSKDMLARLRVEIGDTIHFTEDPDGWRITPYDPEFERQMKIAEDVMREDREILRELAK